MAGRSTYITVASALVAVLLLQMACKQLPESRFNPIRNKPITQTPIQTSPSDPNMSPNSLSTTETPINAGFPVMTTTSELALSTEEWGASTEEGSASTEEAPVVKKELCYVRAEASVFREPNFSSKSLENLKVGSPLLLMPDTPATSEWLLVSTGKVKGYIHQAYTCPNQFCISRKRNGIAALFVQSREMRVPQIQLEVLNIYQQQIRDLRIAAHFYYHGDSIGDDESYVSAETLGIPALRPGESKVVYLRPYFNMPKAEVLNPENAVEVDLYCAMESFNYVPCGKFKIDRMLY